MKPPGPVSTDNCQVAPLGTTQSTRPPSPAKRSGYMSLIITGIFQGLCGVAVLVFAIVFFINSNDVSDYVYSDTDRGRQLISAAVGLISSIMFIIAAVLGIVSKKIKATIPYYMVFSIAACMFACCGLIAIGFGLSYKVHVKYHTCDVDYSHRCCFNRYGGCSNRYYNGFYYEVRTEDVYDSDECCALRDAYGTCLEKHMKISNTLIDYYVLMLIVCVIEGIVAFIGVCFTCTRLGYCKVYCLCQYQTQIPLMPPPAQHQQMISRR